jgi:hypothetical protein
MKFSSGLSNQTVESKRGRSESEKTDYYNDKIITGKSLSLKLRMFGQHRTGLTLLAFVRIIHQHIWALFTYCSVYIQTNNRFLQQEKYTLFDRYKHKI